MTEPVTLPYTGREFLESLDDGREVRIYGERVKNITAHPAFRNCARMLARLYDALHEDHAAGPQRALGAHRVGRVHAPLLPCAEDGGGAGRRTRRDRGLGAAHLRLARAVAGLQGGVSGTLGANAEFYAPYQDNARRWYRYAQERVPFINHAIIHPPVDRNIAPGAPGGPTDIYTRVTRETDAGIYVSGAKVVATGSALTHFTFVAHHGLIRCRGRSSPSSSWSRPAPGA